MEKARGSLLASVRGIGDLEKSLFCVRVANPAGAGRRRPSLPSTRAHRPLPSAKPLPLPAAPEHASAATSNRHRFLSPPPHLSLPPLPAAPKPNAAPGCVAAAHRRIRAGEGRRLQIRAGEAALLAALCPSPSQAPEPPLPVGDLSNT
uniref:Uncharacterized protein n=1 Tax=Oryza glumipatula TaxID=40148 RepID=A0A0E0AKY1_9ORYZ